MTHCAIAVVLVPKARSASLNAHCVCFRRPTSLRANRHALKTLFGDRALPRTTGTLEQYLKSGTLAVDGQLGR